VLNTRGVTRSDSHPPHTQLTLSCHARPPRRHPAGRRASIPLAAPSPGPVTTTPPPPRRASHAASPRHQPPSGALADGPCWRQRWRLRRCGGPSAGAQADPRHGCRHPSPSRGCRRHLSSASSPRVQALRRPIVQHGCASQLGRPAAHPGGAWC